MSATSSSWRAKGPTTGTIFHRVIRMGIVQGGDPLSKDPAKAKLYGTGGLGVLKAEIGGEPATRGRRGGGAAAGQAGQRRRAVLRLRDRSAGADREVHRLRPRLGRHGRRAEDLRGGCDAGRHRRPSASRSTRWRFATRRRRSRCRSAPRRADALRAYRAVLDTSAGPITIEFFPDKAPEHVRELPAPGRRGRLDGTSFHRVVKGFASRPAS